MRKSIRIVALTTCAAVLSVAAAQAQTPMQFWHNEWARQQRVSVQQDGYPYYQPRGWFGGDSYGYAEPGDDGMRDQRPRGPMPQVHVSNPDFYDYKPDALKTVTLDAICAPKVTANPPQLQPVAETTGADVAEQPAPAPVPETAPSPFAQACAAAASTVSLRVLPEVGTALTAWYGAHPQFVWSDGNQVSAKALAAMATLATSDKVGLAPADYRLDMPNLDGMDDAARQAALVRFDVALSAKTLTYVLDATRGRIDPDRISGYHDLPRKTVDLGAAMAAMAQQADVAQWLEQRNPDNAQFRALVAELGRLRAAAPKQTVKLSGDIRIVPGDVSLQLGNVLTAIGAAAPALKQDLRECVREHRCRRVRGRRGRRGEGVPARQAPRARRHHRPRHHRRADEARRQCRQDRQGRDRARTVALAAAPARRPLRLPQPAGLRGQLCQRQRKSR